MRKNLKAKAYVYPLPVLIVGTYDENGVANAMNAAWGTVCDTAQVCICLSATHKTVKNLLQTKAFTGDLQSGTGQSWIQDSTH